MKKSRKFIIIFAVCMTLILVTMIAVCIVSFSDDGTQPTDTDASFNALLVGVDTAANNADVIMLISLSQSDRYLTAIQLPRDTYVSYEGEGRKINSVYARMLSESNGDKHLAMRRFSGFLSENLGVEIDKYALLDTSIFAHVIDDLGGVTLNVPFDMYYEDEAQSLDIAIEKGVQNLSGEQAVDFVRYRYGYIEGDLGRLDAQKMLISALYNKLTTDTSAIEKIKLAAEISKEMVTNFSPRDVLDIYSLATDEGLSLRIMTAPGEAKRYAENSGAWYYVLNKISTENTLKEYINQGRSLTFDKNTVFCDESNLSFKNIYYDKNYTAKIYTDNNIPKLNFRQGG